MDLLIRCSFFFLREVRGGVVQLLIFTYYLLYVVAVCRLFLLFVYSCLFELITT